jgi:hypothetical protein
MFGGNPGSRRADLAPDGAASRRAGVCSDLGGIPARRSMGLAVRRQRGRARRGTDLIVIARKIRR